MYMFLAEELGVALAENLVEVFACERELFGACHYNGEVGQVHNAFKMRHLVGIYLRLHHVTHKQQLRLAMIHYIVNLVGRELILYWHSHSSECERGKEGHSPMAAVASAQGNLVAALHATVLKHDV